MEPNQFPMPPEPPPIPSNVQAQPAAQPSMLERLRERVMQDIMPSETESMQARARAFGAGMLGGQGNFFQRLAAGQQSVAQQQQQEQAARANRLKAAEEETLQRARLQLEEARQRYQQDPNNPQNRYHLAHAEEALARAMQLRSSAGQGRGSDFTVIGESPEGTVVMDRRTGNTQVVAGVRPTALLRQEAASESNYRTRAQALAQRAVRDELQMGRLPEGRIDARQRELEAGFLERLRRGETIPEEGAGGGGREVVPPRTGPTFNYTPPPAR